MELREGHGRTEKATVDKGRLRDKGPEKEVAGRGEEM